MPAARSSDPGGHAADPDRGSSVGERRGRRCRRRATSRLARRAVPPAPSRSAHVEAISASAQVGAHTVACTMPVSDGAPVRGSIRWWSPGPHDRRRVDDVAMAPSRSRRRRERRAGLGGVLDLDVERRGIAGDRGRRRPRPATQGDAGVDAPLGREVDGPSLGDAAEVQPDATGQPQLAAAELDLAPPAARDRRVQRAAARLRSPRRSRGRSRPRPPRRARWGRRGRRWLRVIEREAQERREGLGDRDPAIRRDAFTRDSSLSARNRLKRCSSTANVSTRPGAGAVDAARPGPST